MIRSIVNFIYVRWLRSLVLADVNSAGLHTFRLMGSREKLDISGTAVVNNALFNTNSGRIVIGEYVFFGHDVRVITGSHDIKKTGLKRIQAIPVSGHDIIIEAGVWIASGATIIGPCCIGRDAVVGACALVVGDVPAKTIVGGVPARKIRDI